MCLRPSCSCTTAKLDKIKAMSLMAQDLAYLGRFADARRVLARCAEVARRLGLGAALRMAGGETRTGLRDNDTVVPAKPASHIRTISSAIRRGVPISG